MPASKSRTKIKKFEGRLPHRADQFEVRDLGHEVNISVYPANALELSSNHRNFRDLVMVNKIST